MQAGGSWIGRRKGGTRRRRSGTPAAQSRLRARRRRPSAFAADAELVCVSAAFWKCCVQRGQRDLGAGDAGARGTPSGHKPPCAMRLLPFLRDFLRCAGQGAGQLRLAPFAVFLIVAAAAHPVAECGSWLACTSCPDLPGRWIGDLILELGKQAAEHFAGRRADFAGRAGLGAVVDLLAQSAPQSDRRDRV